MHHFFVVHSRIALVASSYLPRLGGVETHTRAVATELVRRGHDVEVWTVAAADLAPLDVLDSITVRRLPCPLPTGSPTGVAHFVRRVLPAWSAWRAARREFRPDVLHVQCFGPNGVYATALSARTGVRLVVSLHGETFMDDHGAFTHSVMLRTGLRWALRHAESVTGCSQLVLDDARRRFGLRAGSVVFNGVEPCPPEHAVADASSVPAGRFVLAVGRFVPHKGFDLLARAFADIATRHPDVDLVVYGEGPARQSVAADIERWGLAGRVRLAGAASPEVIAEAMRHAEVFVMPSRVEPFGIVVLEAWRAGTPVVASCHGGAPEFIDDEVSGLLVDPFDRHALGAVIERLLDDPLLRRRLTIAGTERLTGFTLGRVADDYELVYRGAPSATCD